jgi:hypothetical protein
MATTHDERVFLTINAIWRNNKDKVVHELENARYLLNAVIPVIYLPTSKYLLEYGGGEHFGQASGTRNVLRQKSLSRSNIS